MPIGTPLSFIVVGEGALLIQCTQILVDRGLTIRAVISGDPAVAKWARQKNFLFEPATADLLAIANREPFDYLFSIINYLVLPAELLAAPRIDAINYHDAPLPRYAGLHATSWAIIAREKHHAVSWHSMNNIVDGGDVYKQRSVEISDTDTAFSLNGKCYATAIEAFAELAEELAEGRASKAPQNLKDRTYFGKYERPPAAGVLDWSKPVEELDALIRGLDFGVYVNPLALPKIALGNQMLIVSNAAVAANREAEADVGKITAANNDFIRVATGSGQLEIKRIMTVDGVPLSLGELISLGTIKVGAQLPGYSPQTIAALSKLNRRICRHEDYWVSQLSRLQPYVLPFLRKSRSGSLEADPKTIQLELPDGLVAFLEGRSIIPTHFLAGAFGAFLARLSDLPTFDIATGVGDLGEELNEYSQLFSADVPIRIETDLGADLGVAVNRFADQLAETQKHLTYSRDICVRHPQLRQLPGLRRARKFPVGLEFSGLSEGPRQMAGRELLFIIDKDANRCRWVYDATIFEPETIRRASGHFWSFLSAFLEKPECPIESLALLTKLEREQITFGTNPRGSLPAYLLPSDGAATLHELFEAQAERSPAAIALVCDTQRLTFGELNKKANHLAGQLRQRGVGPDVLVGICMNRSNDLVVGLLAILKAGGAYLPIDLAYPADRLAFMLADAQAPILLTESSLTGKLPVTTAKILCIDSMFQDPSDPASDDNLAPLSNPDHLAYVIYTSGTTGKPKGTLITHRNVVRLFSSTEHWYNFNERDIWTLFHSSAFDFSVWEIWGGLLYGGRVVVVPFMVSRSPEAFYELLAAERVTVLNQTPSAFRQLIQAEESVGPKALALRYVIFGGEALEMQSLRPWFDRHGDEQPRLINMYGITETTVHVTYRPLSKTDLNSGSVIGIPIPDLQVYILDRRLEPMPLGIAGEMYVGGAGLARGYLRRPELTNERFITDHLSGRPGARLYKTGDLARFLPGRDIEYLGRIDHQVKIRGFRVELGEIESVLCQHPMIRESLVLPREDAGVKRLVAYVVTPGRIPVVSELRDHLGKKLPDYMVPASYVFLEKFPLTASGKIDRAALPEPAQERPELASAFVAPRNDVETGLAGIWSRILGVGRVGINDNFFELGGDSILSIQVISLSRQAGLNLSPKLLFQHPTIAELSGAVMPTVQLAGAEQGLVEGSTPLTPIQSWFFEQNLSDAHWYNQAFLFSVRKPLQFEPLKQALDEIERHHDALRLRLSAETPSPTLTFAPPREKPLLEWKDCSAIPDDHIEPTLLRECTNAQMRLDHRKGPLCAAVYFDLGPNRPPRLLLAIHHLAVDGVSWRILLEDLEMAYDQILSGKTVSLALKSTSIKQWAEKMVTLANQPTPALGQPYWWDLADRKTLRLPTELNGGPNTEGSTVMLSLRLEPEETEALLKRAPRAYSTQINDLLLTALGRALAQWTGSPSVFLNLEGHGREDLFDGIDLSRTLGWFTSIYPLQLNLAGKEIGAAIKSIKEQLRAVPARGVGYGITRYLRRDERLSTPPEPEIVFNYLGQLDQLVDNSRLFGFAMESPGPWHSPNQRRRHAIEINCAVLRRGLEIWWTYSGNLHRADTMKRVAAAFVENLRGIIAHCTQPGVSGATPSDFPLAGLDQAALDGLMARVPDLEDVYPLAPVQALFYSVGASDVKAVIDHWECTLIGPLDVNRFRNAWEQLVARHSALRTSFHSAGLKEPLQIVHRMVVLPWAVADWRGQSKDQQNKRWTELLAKESEAGLALDQAPLHRITLVRMDDDRSNFLWIIPALLLDGWSWPVVFRDLSKLYGASGRASSAFLPPVRPYRECVAWLRQRTLIDDEPFWRENLKGFQQPTPLIAEPGDLPSTAKRQSAEWTRTLDAETTSRIISFARQLRVTPSTLILAAWGMVLSKLSGRPDVVFGAAFSGRSPEMRDSANIVGPFVNNLPIRVQIEHGQLAEVLLRQLHDRLLEINPHQFAPLAQIQSWSEVGWRNRLFESIVVIQNYEIDEAARRLGDDVSIADFAAPIHSNFPLLILVEPGATWRVTLIHDRRELPASRVAQWGNDLVNTLRGFALTNAVSLAALLDGMSAPAGKLASKPRLRVQSLNYVPPQSEMEHAITKIWQEIFQTERISVEENLFDLGAHSLLVIRLHLRLREALGREISLVDLFQFPTIRSLARHIGVPEKDASGAAIHTRAQQQRDALARMRRPVAKK